MELSPLRFILDLGTGSEHDTFQRILQMHVDCSEQEWKENLECPICLGVLFEPVQTRCGHLYCTTCILGMKSCAMCRKELTDADQFLDRKQERLIKTQPLVHCPNSVDCGWTGNIGSLHRHFKSECGFELCDCSLGCGISFKRNMMRTHFFFICPEGNIKCDLCELDMKRKEKQQHGMMCPKHLIQCEQCKQEVTRENAAEHKKSQCPRQPLSCLICKQVVLRQEMHSHVGNFCASHVILLAQQHIDLKEIVKQQAKLIEEQAKQYEALLLSKSRNTEGRRVWKIHGVDNDVLLPAFYFGGYKFRTECIFKNSYIGLFFHVVKGENDHQLSWPLQLTFEFQILNQERDASHITRGTSKLNTVEKRMPRNSKCSGIISSGGTWRWAKKDIFIQNPNHFQNNTWYLSVCIQLYQMWLI